jgi:hypothetical protein
LVSQNSGFDEWIQDPEVNNPDYSRNSKAALDWPIKNCGSRYICISENSMSQTVAIQKSEHKTVVPT